MVAELPATAERDPFHKVEHAVPGRLFRRRGVFVFIALCCVVVVRRATGPRAVLDRTRVRNNITFLADSFSLYILMLLSS